MRSIRPLATLCVAVAMMSLAGRPAHAQAMAGRDLGQNRVHVAYYKTPPGRQDEWLALYKKYHKPIMDLEIKEGLVVSDTVYAPRYHDGEKSWDFIIITIQPPEGQEPKLRITRAEEIRKLFPDIRNYVRGERARWALTLVCQEGDLVKIDMSRDPVSVYYPLDFPEKKK
ncbi:MAG TPA: hypothetical protein VGT07_07010 [Steroidobacteraceae bacterium]|nr:hypothetical protein [Steroidobacteraceae bacterium]